MKRYIGYDLYRNTFLRRRSKTMLFALFVALFNVALAAAAGASGSSEFAQRLITMVIVTLGVHWAFHLYTRFHVWLTSVDAVHRAISVLFGVLSVIIAKL